MTDVTPMTANASASVELHAVCGLPMVKPGDDLSDLLLSALQSQTFDLRDGDVVVVAQKIVSKAENRLVDLGSIKPSAEASRVASIVLKDPRLVEVILSQSRRIVRCVPNVLIVEHSLGLIMANAGVDQSNVATAPEGEAILLLPEDPDASAETLRRQIRDRAGAQVAVLINDSFGRPWRKGSVGVAIGAAGFPSVEDRRGDPDLFGRPLEATVVGLADEVAAAASLVMGPGDEGYPAVIVRGLAWRGMPAPASEICRRPEEDLFR